MQKKAFDLPTPAVPDRTGAQPSKFHAEYDSQKQEYRRILSGFLPAADGWNDDSVLPPHCQESRRGKTTPPTGNLDGGSAVVVLRMFPQLLQHFSASDARTFGKFIR
jgi:hypothetical protein